MARAVYSDEFRRGAVEQVIVRRHTVSSAAQRPGVAYDTIRKWVEQIKYDSDSSLIPADLPVGVSTPE